MWPRGWREWRVMRGARRKQERMNGPQSTAKRAARCDISTRRRRPADQTGRALYCRPAPPEAAVSTEARIEVLEIRIAHLERALQDLSDAMYRQQQRLDAQQAHYQLLVDRIDAAEPRSAATTIEVPPHY